MIKIEVLCANQGMKDNTLIPEGSFPNMDAFVSYIMLKEIPIKGDIICVDDFLDKNMIDEVSQHTGSHLLKVKWRIVRKNHIQLWCESW